MKPLREMRADRLLTMRSLVALAGVDQMTVCRVENGQTTPRIIVIKKLCAALGCEPEDVIEFRRAIDQALDQGWSYKRSQKS